MDKEDNLKAKTYKHYNILKNISDNILKLNKNILTLLNKKVNIIMYLICSIDKVSA